MEFSFEDKVKESKYGIEQSGFYVGTILSAEAVKSSSSISEGIEFSVKTSQGETKFTLWYKNKEGNINQFAVNKIADLAGVILPKGEKLKLGKIRANKFDFETKRSFPEVVNGYPQLTNVEVGMLIALKEEEYNGKVKKKADLINFYAVDGKDVDEFLGNKTPKALLDFLTYMKKNPKKYGDGIFIDSSITGEISEKKVVQQKDELPKVELKEDNIPF